MKNRVGKKIEIKVTEDIMDNINLLKELTKKNQTKDFADKLKSLLSSETYSSLFIEGEISSRRNIKRGFKDINKLVPGKEKEIIENFINAYAFALKPKEFNHKNLFTLYSLVSNVVIEEEDKLEDGTMWRHEDVYISTNALNGNYKGFNPSDIKEALDNLFTFLNDQSIDIFVRAIWGHFYFETIHPYFDFNGRTGRFLPMWLFANEGKPEQMMYFATAMGNYRDQYLKIFKSCIDLKTYDINFKRAMSKLSNLLILNQKQYIWIKKLEDKYIGNTNKKFTDLQKSLIWTLMIKSQVSNTQDSWFKLTKKDKTFIESELKPSYFSQELKKLVDAKIIGKTDGLDKKYKLFNYKLF